uniref:Uncharacterized protein n=1 Tax=Oryza sativa subsp. japonica TaxID=39947 RepID=Q69K75_ORYSJ|nr:hypothetical protein [Oryza sativa Japonica Group]
MAGRAATWGRGAGVRMWRKRAAWGGGGAGGCSSAPTGWRRKTGPTGIQLLQQQQFCRFYWGG